MKIFGITGNIATGKSAVTNYLRNLNYTVICADEIYNELLKTDKKLLKAISQNFPNAIEKNGALNKKKLADIVFNDSKKLKILNKITHPFVINKINKILKNYKSEKIIFLSAPLLIESGIHKMCDKIICLTTIKKLQIERLKQRNPLLSKKEIISRISAQMPSAEKIKYSDFIIKNTKDLKNLYKQVDNILKKI
ncbi:MAG TPA: dephospho-CoA kinase [bacterium]|nr:dephospho-CoA kinase [bacterium]HPP86638.1 dephospho-CoA kinase [bacterium]